MKVNINREVNIGIIGCFLHHIENKPIISSLEWWVLSAVITQAFQYYFANKPVTMDSVALSLFVGLFGFFLIKILALVLKTTKTLDELKENISQVGEKQVIKILSAADIYSTEIQVLNNNRNADELFKMINLAISQQQNNGHGIFIAIPKTSIKTYAKVSIKFLEQAKKSVWSMSDVGLDLTFYLFSEPSDDANKTNLLRWISSVNSRAQPKKDRKPIDVKRLQVITEGRLKFFEKLEAYASNKTCPNTIMELLTTTRKNAKRGSSDAEMADYILNGFHNYQKRYIEGYYVKDDEAKDAETTAKINWYVYMPHEAQDSSVVRGEYIIFDERYLVRYNEEANVLEVMAGGIVKRFSEPFADDTALQDMITDSVKIGKRLGGEHANKYPTSQPTKESVSLNQILINDMLL